MSKRSYVHVPVVPYPAVHDAQNGGAGRVGIPGVYQGGYTGWVIRGHIPSQPALLEEGPAAVQRPQGAGPALGRVVRKQAGAGRTRCSAGGDGSQDHPAGPVGLPWSPPCPGTLRMPASGPYGRDLTSFPVKLVKTRECHRNITKRPVIVPILRNGSGKSPLDFLRFLFSVAFSHKELMVPF